jgi:hypothetical protein
MCGPTREKKAFNKLMDVVCSEEKPTSKITVFQGTQIATSSIIKVVHYEQHFIRQ